MNDQRLLQNTPNSREYDPKSKGAKAFAVFLDGAGWLTYTLGILVFFLIALLCFTVQGLSQNQFGNKTGSSEVGLILICVGGIVLVAFYTTFLYRKSVNRPLQDQMRYYELGNVRPLTPVQQRALRLHLVEMYQGGFWLNTLEYFPCDVRVSSPKFKPKSFAVAERHVYKQGLNQDWGIVSEAQYHTMTAELFDGMHSRLFALDMDYALHYDTYLRGKNVEDRKVIESQNANFINRLAGLIDKPATYVMACVERRTDRPESLIWAFDLWRVIPMSREAFMAGYISEEQAWKNILRSANLIYFLFDSFEDFYDNLRLGNAYWSNDLNVTSDRLEMWKLYIDKCDWPQKDLPWASPETPEISEDMQTGFKAYVGSKNKAHHEVGFRFNDSNLREDDR